ncbi:hypothetical protein ABGV40_14910 [Paenibacillus amylolyticus]|uniref:hypothetical protein n=1 Tax=Paenibacillus amylolyticus TaxID=1451 RepID=UPI00324233B1
MPTLDTFSLDNHRIDGNSNIDPANLKTATGSGSFSSNTPTTIGNLAFKPLFMTITSTYQGYWENGQTNEFRVVTNISLSATGSAGRSFNASGLGSYRRNEFNDVVYQYHNNSGYVGTVVFGENSVTITATSGFSGTYVIYGY